MQPSFNEFTQKVFRLRLELWVALEEILDENGLTVAQWLILYTLGNARDGLKVSDLASQQGVLASQVTRYTLNLVKDGYVHSVKNPDDARSVIVSLTPLGRKKLDEAEQGLKAYGGGLKERIANGDWQVIVDYLTPKPAEESVIRLCVLQAGDNNPEMERDVPGFADLFRSMFEPFSQIKPEFIQVRHGEFPDNIDEWDAFLVTGGARLDDDLEWAEELRALIRKIDESGKPLIGICFGHQIISDTLGGKSELSDYWRLGVREVDVHSPPPFCEGYRDTLKLIYYSKEHVVSPPPGATVFAGSAYCPIAAYHVDDRILCFQGHPEFTPEVVDATMEFRKDVLGSDNIESARTTLADNDDSKQVTASIVNFIEMAKSRAQPRAA